MHAVALQAARFLGTHLPEGRVGPRVPSARVAPSPRRSLSSNSSSPGAALAAPAASQPRKRTHHAPTRVSDARIAPRRQSFAVAAAAADSPSSSSAGAATEGPDFTALGALKLLPGTAVTVRRRAHAACLCMRSPSIARASETALSSVRCADAHSRLSEPSSPSPPPPAAAARC